MRQAQLQPTVFEVNMVAPEVVKPLGLTFMKDDALLQFFGYGEPQPNAERFRLAENTPFTQVQPGIAIEF